MRVRIQLFALARERAGQSAVELEVPEPATVAALKQALAHAHPALAPLVPVLRFAINSEYSADDAPIPPAAEVAAIPPVSGGAGLPRRYRGRR